MRPILIQIGPIPIFTYGLLLATGFILAAWMAARRARKVGIAEDHIWNLATWVFVGTLAGARGAFILIEQPELLKHPLQWFAIWNGGLIFYGGLILSTILGVVYMRRHKLPVWQVLDICVPPVSLGYAIGRIGCFMNGCCYGKPVSWGLSFLHGPPDRLPRHPTQLYETAAGLLLFGLLLLWEKHIQRAKGELVLLYFATYGMFRALIEFLRDDYRGGAALGLSPAQLIGVASFILGFAWLIRRRVTPPPAPGAGASPA